MDMISPSIAALTPSLTLKVTNRAKAMKASGEEVYGLAGGEPEMDTPENIKQAAIAALNNGLEAVKCNVLFSSHDHQLVQTVANRVFDFTPGGQLIDRQMTYDEYLERKNAAAQ